VSGFLNRVRVNVEALIDLLPRGSSASPEPVFHLPFIQSLPQLFKLCTILERSATAEKSQARDAFPSVKVGLASLESFKGIPLILQTPTGGQYARPNTQRPKHPACLCLNDQ
jgi:hypothetical protein